MNEKTKRLEYFIKNQNINKSTLAKSLKMAHASISLICSGKNNITDSFCFSLQAIYNLSPDWLLHGTEPMYLPHENRYTDDRQKAINEAYEYVSEQRKEIIHDTAIKQHSEEKIHQKKQLEYERKHREDVKRMIEEKVVPAEMIQIPIAGYVQAGIPTWTEEVHEGSLTWDKSRISSPENAFWLRIQGTSMIDCGMYPDDAILCDSGVIPRRGDAVIAKINEEMTVKKYRRYLSEGMAMIELIPCNEEFKTISYPEKEVQIVAVVIANDWRLKRGEEKTWKR